MNCEKINQFIKKNNINDENILNIKIEVNSDVITIMKGKFILEQDVTRKIDVPDDPEQYIKDYIVKHWDYFMKDRFLLWNEFLPVAMQKVHNLWCIVRKRK